MTGAMTPRVMKFGVPQNPGYQSSRGSHVLRRFPFGGGSRCVRLYVTVLVTTCRTLTGLPPALRGVSIYRIFQSEGENGDRIVRALPGDSVPGE